MAMSRLLMVAITFDLYFTVAVINHNECSLTSWRDFQALLQMPLRVLCVQLSKSERSQF